MRGENLNDTFLKKMNRINEIVSPHLTNRGRLITVTQISFKICAEMVELVDTQVSDACGGNPVEVRVLFSAPNFKIEIINNDSFYIII
jgi:hypothetical protein